MKTEIVKKRINGSCRTGGLSGVTVADIDRILGFRGNCPDDPYKVVNSWQFEYEGVPCAIWDYKGSEKYNTFSTFGPRIVFEKLFGGAYDK
jgi:hypothetical protein